MYLEILDFVYKSNVVRYVYLSIIIKFYLTQFHLNIE